MNLFPSCFSSLYHPRHVFIWAHSQIFRWYPHPHLPPINLNIVLLLLLTVILSVFPQSRCCSVQRDWALHGVHPWMPSACTDWEIYSDTRETIKRFVLWHSSPGSLKNIELWTVQIPAACFEIMYHAIIITVMTVILAGLQVMRAACISTRYGPACLDFSWVVTRAAASENPTSALVWIR